MLDEKPQRDDSLADAQDWLWERIGQGAQCPCCTQFAKVYRRILHNGMARALIHMYLFRDENDTFRTTSHIITKNGDTAKLRYWGLITDDGGVWKRGRWRVTRLGEDFVRGRTTVHSHVRIYDGKLLGVYGDRLTIKQALGTKFDYDELMATDGGPGPKEQG